jgi:hypothetical protein
VLFCVGVLALCGEGLSSVTVWWPCAGFLSVTSPKGPLLAQTLRVKMEKQACRAICRICQTCCESFGLSTLQIMQSCFLLGLCVLLFGSPTFFWSYATFLTVSRFVLGYSIRVLVFRRISLLWLD